MTAHASQEAGGRDVAKRHWVGVASHEHVRRAVEGGFFQANHGKEAPLKRVARGGRVLFYSPREGMRSGKAVNAFTAIGTVADAGTTPGDWCCVAGSSK